MARKIILFDTTMRDGSHALRHEFEPGQAEMIAGGLDAAGVKYIEVSHGDGLGGSSYTYGFSKTDEFELIEAAARKAVNAKIAVLLLPGIGTIGALEKADLAILIVGADEGFTPGDERNAAMCEGKKRIFVINKTDLAPERAIGEICEAIIGREDGAGSDGGPEIVRASLINGIGLDKIEKSIVRLFAGHSPPAYGDAVLTNARHHALVLRGLESIRSARDALGAGMPYEIPVVDMREALSALGEITGETFSESIIDKIFSEFCIGK